MKFEICNNPKATGEPPVRLWPEIQTDGSVVISAVDRNGEHVSCGDLFVLTVGGRIRRCVSINTALGFDLDSQGRIRVENV